MNFLARYKWFWMTLGAWFALGTFSAWALIFSPFHLETRKVSEFSATVNGVQQENRILVSPAPIGTGLEALTKEWEAEGWKPATGNINLVNTLLNTPKDCRSALDRLAQLRLYRKKDRLRLLGLLTSVQDGQTYHWVSEMPQSALVSPEPSSTAIPLKLPDNASNITVVKIGKTQAIVFTVPAPFGLHSLGPSFSERPLATRNGTEACLLQKGAVKWMAVMDKTGPQNRVSLMELTSH